MEDLRKNIKKMLEIKKTNKMKTTFDGLISKLDIDKERISLKICQQNFSKWNAKRKNINWKQRNRMFKNCGTITKGIKYAQCKYWK